MRESLQFRFGSEPVRIEVFLRPQQGRQAAEPESATRKDVGDDTKYLFLYRSTVFWTHSATTSCCRSQQTALLMSDLGGRFVSMPSNQPGLIVSTLKLA